MGETIRMRTGDAVAPAYRSGLVTALDIGSSKTVCLIGRAEPAQLRVLGVGPRESRGIKAGTITSLEYAEESIREAMDAAENLADLKVHAVLVSVNCGAPRSATGRAAMALNGALVSDAHLPD